MPLSDEEKRLRRQASQKKRYATDTKFKEKHLKDAKKRYATDTKFREKQKAVATAYNKKRYATDTKFKEKHLKDNKKRYATDPKYKNTMKSYVKKYQKERYATDTKFKEKHLATTRKNQKERYEPDGVWGQAKAKVFVHYSKVISNSDVPICACCGYSDLRFLSVDHIDGRKNMSEKEKKLGSGHLWVHLVKIGLPSGYQILCYNCNIAKGREKYCPHQLDKMKGTPVS